MKVGLSNLVVAAALLTATTALQCRGIPADQPSSAESLLPHNYDPKFPYPVVVLLPPLGATADDVLRGFLPHDWFKSGTQASFETWLSHPPPDHGGDAGRRGFILLLAGGKGTLEHGFDATIRQTETDVAQALERLRSRHPFDSRRVVLAGFSLGGDVSFAMVLRHPERFAGAVIMSSGMNYGGKYLEGLPGRHLRMYLTMGALDPRLAGMKRSRQLIDQKGVTTAMTLVPGQEHQQPPGIEFLRGVSFVLASDSK